MSATAYGFNAQQVQYLVREETRRKTLELEVQALSEQLQTMRTHHESEINRLEQTIRANTARLTAAGF